MTRQTVVLAADHAGYQMKDLLRKHIEELGYETLDLGTNGPDSVDYPDFGHAAGKIIVEGGAGKGVIVCGSGIGISIAANRYPEVRAALCHDGLTARLARQHNDANVLALGARIVRIEMAREAVTTFLDTKFEGGRHQSRVDKLNRPEGLNDIRKDRDVCS